MNQNNQNDQKSNQQGISSSGSNGQQGKQAGGKPSYEDERKDKSKGMSAPGRSSSTEDVTVAKQGAQPQTTLNTSGVQEGGRSDRPLSQDIDSDEDIDNDQDEAQRRTA